MLLFGKIAFAIIAVRMIAGFAIIVYFNSAVRPALQTFIQKAMGTDSESRYTDTVNHYDRFDPIHELGPTDNILCVQKRAVLLAKNIVKNTKSASCLIHVQISLLTALLLYLHLSDGQEASINNIETYLAKSKGELDMLFENMKPTDPAFCAKQYYYSFLNLSTSLANNAKSGLLIVIHSIQNTSSCKTVNCHTQRSKLYG